MTYRPHLLPKLRSPKIMASAAGQPCTLRLAGFLGLKCAGTDTTVSCHLPTSGKGVGTKVTDLAVAFGCSTCHLILDESLSSISDTYPSALGNRLLAASMETLTILADEGLISINDNRAEWLSSGPYR